jgi:outer membrane protein TolC
MRIHALILCLAASTGIAAETNHLVRALTLRECIERALANNLEVRFERINPSIANWGIVQQQGVFDPGLTAGLTYNEASVPSTSGSYSDRSLVPSLGLGGRLPTGTSYDFTVRDERANGSAYANDPFYTGATTLSLTQPLLKNFGLDANLSQIRVARKSRDIAIENFALTLMGKISEVSMAYYELVFAIEDHKAKLEDLSRAKRLLEENRKRVQVGVMSPLDVTQAEAGAAEREEAVILTERAIKDRENAVKRLIAAEVREFLGVSLLPTDAPLVEMVETDVARSISAAFELRPDYRALRHEVDRRQILVQFNRNQLWPELDLIASYGLNGMSLSGFGDLTARQLRHDDPAWGVGIAVTIPLGNRTARANYNIARLDREQALLSLKQLEQNIVVQVDNAVGRVQTNLKRVEATRVASRLAEESLKAEETKLRAGTSTSFLVLQAQSQLAAARSAEIRARTDYRESLIELARVEGATLQKNNITLDEKF